MNKKIKQILGGAALVLMVVFGIVPWFLADLDIWGYMFTGIFILVGITELISKKIYDHTISQLFWKFSKEHPKTSIGLCASLVFSILMLCAHLLIH